MAGGKSIVETLGAVDKALSALERLGKWGLALMAIVPGGVAYVWAVAGQIPSSVAGVLALYAVAGGLWLHNGLNDLRRIRQQSAERPNYEGWDHVENFTFGQAANLWAGLEPGAMVKRKGYPYLRMLKEQALDGTIKATLDQGSYTMDSMVSRSELRKLAEDWGLHPTFLYPEDRWP